jgi:ComF family protein
MHRAVARLLGGFAELGASFLDLCFPRRCAGCEETWLFSAEGFWCEACLDEIPWIRSPLCAKCGRPFHKSAPSADHLCGDCLLSAFSFDSARSATAHSGVVRDRIHQLKFGGQLRFVPPLVELLERTLHERGCMDRVNLLAPVPLHVKRLGQRGFNQAGVMARALGGRLGLPVCLEALVRKQWTDPQTRLSRPERLENVKGAFDVPDKSSIKGRNILLIDDVFTTGTTLSECAKTLKASGAAEVHALTVTRAIPDRKGGGEVETALV